MLDDNLSTQTLTLVHKNPAASKFVGARKDLFAPIYGSSRDFIRATADADKNRIRTIGTSGFQAKYHDSPDDKMSCAHLLIRPITRQIGGVQVESRYLTGCSMPSPSRKITFLDAIPLVRNVPN